MPVDADLPIIDCDIHPSPSEKNPLEPFIPKDFHEALRQRMGSQKSHAYGNPFGVTRRDANCHDPLQVAADHLDRYNIAYGVLQPPGMTVSLIHNIDVANAMATAWNDWTANTWLAADKRYRGSICLNMNDPAAAVKELHRAAKNPQMVQTTITTESSHLYGHRSYFPVYQALNDLNLPLAMHVGAEGSLDSSTPVGRPASYLEWHTGVPITCMAHLISLVSEGVFEKFPRLKVLFTEAGVSWFSHVMWRMDKNFKALRSTTPWLKRMPSEYMLEHIRLSTQPMEEIETPDMLLQMLGMIHAEKTLLFATDFPHWDFDAPEVILPRKVPQSMKERIFYENAAELYHLPTLAEARANRELSPAGAA